MSKFMFLGISTIGRDLPEEFVKVLLMVALLAYVSVIKKVFNIYEKED